MLQCKIFEGKKYIGEYDIDIEFKNEGLQTILNFIIYSSQINRKKLEDITQSIFTGKVETYRCNIHINSQVIIMNNPFITETTRTLSTFEIKGFSTKFIIENSMIKREQKLYEKIIEDIEEDGYQLYNTTIKEFDNYRLLELAYVKDEDE